MTIKNLTATLQQEIAHLLEERLSNHAEIALDLQELCDFRPTHQRFDQFDLCTVAAIKITRSFQQKPSQIAMVLADRLNQRAVTDASVNTAVAKYQATSNGFINIRLSENTLATSVATVFKQISTQPRLFPQIQTPTIAIDSQTAINKSEQANLDRLLKRLSSLLSGAWDIRYDIENDKPLPPLMDCATPQNLLMNCCSELQNLVRQSSESADSSFRQLFAGEYRKLILYVILLSDDIDDKAPALQATSALAQRAMNHAQGLALHATRILDSEALVHCNHKHLTLRVALFTTAIHLLRTVCHS